MPEATDYDFCRATFGNGPLQNDPRPRSGMNNVPRGILNALAVAFKVSIYNISPNCGSNSVQNYHLALVAWFAASLRVAIGDNQRWIQTNVDERGVQTVL